MLAMEPPLTRIPKALSGGSPASWRNQRRTDFSSSAPAGLWCHRAQFWLNAAVRLSANTAARAGGRVHHAQVARRGHLCQSRQDVAGQVVQDLFQGPAPGRASRSGGGFRSPRGRSRGGRAGRPCRSRSPRSGRGIPRPSAGSAGMIVREVRRSFAGGVRRAWAFLSRWHYTRPSRPGVNRLLGCSCSCLLGNSVRVPFSISGSEHRNRSRNRSQSRSRSRYRYRPRLDRLISMNGGVPWNIFTRARNRTNSIHTETQTLHHGGATRGCGEWRPGVRTACRAG